MDSPLSHRKVCGKKFIKLPYNIGHLFVSNLFLFALLYEGRIFSYPLENAKHYFSIFLVECAGNYVQRSWHSLSLKDDGCFPMVLGPFP